MRLPIKDCLSYSCSMVRLNVSGLMLGPYVIKTRYEIEITLESVVSRTMGRSGADSDSVALQLTR